MNAKVNKDADWLQDKMLAAKKKEEKNGNDCTHKSNVHITFAIKKKKKLSCPFIEQTYTKRIQQKHIHIWAQPHFKP